MPQYRSCTVSESYQYEEVRMGSDMAPVEPDKIAYQTPEINKLGNIKVVTRSVAVLGTGDLGFALDGDPLGGILASG